MEIISPPDPLTGDLSCRLWILEGERRMLAALPERLLYLLDNPERSPRILDRLFPVTHAKSDAEEAEHRKLIGDTLFDARREALAEFIGTLPTGPHGEAIYAVDLNTAKLNLWLHVINDFRLLLGTELNIQGSDWRDHIAESNEEDAESLALLEHLSFIQQLLLSVFEASLYDENDEGVDEDEVLDWDPSE